MVRTVNISIHVQSWNIVKMVAPVALCFLVIINAAAGIYMYLYDIDTKYKC